MNLSNNFIYFIMTNINNVFYGKIDMKDFESGGQSCLLYMTDFFKILVTIITVPIYATLIQKLIYKTLFNKNSDDMYYKDTSYNNDILLMKKSSLIEKLFGLLGILVYCFTVYKKANSQSLLFMLNPCHTLGLLQSICLLLKKSKFTDSLVIITTNLLFCSVTALKSPNLVGLDQLEIMFFFIEHFNVLFTFPFAIIYFGRFNDLPLFNITSLIISHCFFGLYQRVLLFPLSRLTLVNLNYTLCCSLSDPFVKYIGIYYYIMSDYYLIVLSYITKLFMHFIAYMFLGFNINKSNRKIKLIKNS